MGLKKGVALFFILLFPVLFYMFLSTGKHNVLEVDYFGPRDSIWKTVDGERVLDTVIFHTVSDFAFTDQRGRTITREDVQGKIFVVDFFFTTCKGICPQMSSELTHVQEAFAGDPEVMILSHTVNPEEDSVAVMAAYAESYAANPEQWLFLTGEKKALYDQARKSYMLSVAPGDGGEHDFIHSEDLILVDNYGRIRGVFDGTSHKDTKELIEDIRKLKADQLVPKKNKK